MTETLGDPTNFLQLATFWEERGKDTGNPHWHGIFVLTRQHRMRPLQFKAWLQSLLEELPEPHVEVCKNIAAAAEYRDKPGKAEAWQKWQGNTREPAFFVLIRMGCYKTIPDGADDLILQSCASGMDLMRKLSLQTLTVLPEGVKSCAIISNCSGLKHIVPGNVSAFGFTELRVQENLALL